MEQVNKNKQPVIEKPSSSLKDNWNLVQKKERKNSENRNFWNQVRSWFGKICLVDVYLKILFRIKIRFCFNLLSSYKLKPLKGQNKKVKKAKKYSFFLVQNLCNLNIYINRSKKQFVKSNIFWTKQQLLLRWLFCGVHKKNWKILVSYQ